MNKKPTLLHKLFVAVVTTSMVLGMCPLQAIADELMGQDVPAPVENGDVTIVDGEPVLGASEEAEAGDVAATSDVAAAGDESPTDGGLSTMSTVGTMANEPNNMNISGGEYEYDSEKDIVTLTQSGVTYQIGRKTN